MKINFWKWNTEKRKFPSFEILQNQNHEDHIPLTHVNPELFKIWKLYCHPEIQRLTQRSIVSSVKKHRRIQEIMRRPAIIKGHSVIIARLIFLLCKTPENNVWKNCMKISSKNHSGFSLQTCVLPWTHTSLPVCLYVSLLSYFLNMYFSLSSHVLLNKFQ